MQSMTRSLYQLCVLLLVLGIMCYAMMLIVLGPFRARKTASHAAGAVAGGIGKLLWYLLRIVVMGTINTIVLVVRLAASLGRPELVVEAWARYVERMADLLLGR